MRAVSFRLAISAILLLVAFASWHAALGADANLPRADALGYPLPPAALARFGTIRFGTDSDHPSFITLSPNGELLAVRNRQGISLLETATGKEVRTLHEGKGGDLHVYRVQFSPDGKRLAGVILGRVSVWDVATGKWLGSFQPAARQILHQIPVAFSADGKLLATGVSGTGDKLPIAIWDVTEKKQVKAFAAPADTLVEVALSPDGKVLATWGGKAGESGKVPPIQLWDVASGKELRALEIDAGRASVPIFSPDGKHLLVAEDGSTLSIWEVSSGTRLRRFATRRRTGAALGYSPDGKLLIAGTTNGGLQYWDAATGKRVGQCQGPGGTLTSVAFLGGDKVRAVTLFNRSASLWEGSSDPELTHRLGHEGTAHTLAFSRDGKALLSGDTDGVRVWELATGKEIRRLEGPSAEETRNLSRYHPYFLSPDGRYAVRYGRNGRSVVMVDVTSGLEIAELQGHMDDDGLPVACAGDTVVAAGRATETGEDAVIHVWDLRTGQETRTIKLPADRRTDRAVTLSPDGTMLALTARERAGRDQTPQTSLWDLANGRHIATLPENIFVRSAVFSPESTYLATASGNGSVHLWDTITGREIRTLERDEGRDLRMVAISPDGRMLAAISDEAREDGDCKVVLWELVSGKMRSEFVGHRGGVVTLAFSPDGRILATTGGDTTVLLWDLTGRTDVAARAKAGPTAEELARLWADLDSPNARKAHSAMARLTGAPVEALALLHRELKAVPGKAPTEKELERMLFDLDDDSFEVRDKASRALKEAGPAVRAALVKALKGNPSAEKTRRLEELHGALSLKAFAPEMIRLTRALEVLERVGSPEARRVLESLARGNSSALLTAEATAALRRLVRDQ